MTSHTLYKYVEIQQGAFNYTCFAHGTASLGTIYDPMALTDGYGTTWYAYIGSTAYESNSFAPYFIAEMAEHTGGSSSCSGWSADGMFAATGSNWQWSRYVQSTRTWKVVQSSDKYWVRLDDFWDDPRTVFDL